MVNKTYRGHGEQLFKGNIGRQQCFYALGRNTRHGSTYEVHLGLESRSGVEDRAVPPLRHSTPHRLQMGPALPARGPRRSRRPLPRPAPSSPANRAPSGRPHSGDPRPAIRCGARRRSAPCSSASSLSSTRPQPRRSARSCITKGSPGHPRNAAAHRLTANLWHTPKSPTMSSRSTSRAGSCAAMAVASIR